MQYKKNFKNAQVYVKEITQHLSVNEANKPIFLQYGYLHLFEDEHDNQKKQPEHTSVNAKRTHGRKSTGNLSVSVHKRADGRKGSESASGDVQ